MQRGLVGSAKRRSQMFLARAKQLGSRSPEARSLPGYGRQPAGITKDPNGPFEFHSRKPLQQGPDGRVRDVEVFIIRSIARLSRREADTATESCDRKRVENINLRFGERISLVIGRNRLSSSPDRVALIEHHVGQRNGQLANGRRMDHVAIIENRGGPLFGWLTNQNVVVVRVIVDDTETQTAPINLVPLVEETFDQRPA